MRQEPPYKRIAREIKEEWILKPSALPGSRLPTERKLRDLFGVSRATIARALDELAAEGLVETRQGSGAYVQEASTPNAAKRLVAFITPHIPRATPLGDSLPVRVYSGIERRAADLGYHLITASSNFSVDQEEELIERFMRLGVDGVILQPVNYPEPRLRESASTDHLARRWQKLPIVLTDIGFDEWRRPIVAFDNYRLGFDMTGALLEHGHRNILLMQTSSSRLHNAIHDRRRGWEAAMARAGIEIPGSYMDWPLSIHDYAHNLEPDLLSGLVAGIQQLRPRPDALVAWDDLAAMQLIAALTSAGVAVPGEIRVTGFDNHEAGRLYDLPFPTSDPDFPRMGEMAMEVLHQRITDRAQGPRTYILPVPVLWREPAAGGPAAPGGPSTNRAPSSIEGSV